MPSLSALNEFKTSFDNIASVDMPYVDLALPETEAPPFEPTRNGAGKTAQNDDFILPDQTEEDASFSGGGDFDFGAFVNSLPTDVAPPPIDDIIPNGEPVAGDDMSLDDMFSDIDALGAPSADVPSEDATPSGEDMSLDDLLSGGGFGDTAADDTPTGEDTSLDDLLSGGGFGDTAADDTPTGEDTSLDDLLSGDGFGDASAGESAPVDETPADFDLSGMGLPDDIHGDTVADDTPSGEDTSLDDLLSGGGFGDAPAGESAPVDETPADFDLSGMGLPDDMSGETSASEGIPLDDLLSGGSIADEPSDVTPEEEPSFDLGGETQDGTFNTGGDSPDPDIFSSGSPDGSPDDNPFADDDLSDLVSKDALSALDSSESFSEESTPEDSMPSDSMSADAFDLGGGAIDLGGETADGSFDMGSDGLLSDMDFPAETPSAGSDIDFDSLMGGSADSFDTGGEESPLAGLDLGDDFNSDSIELANESGAHEDASSGDDVTPADSLGDDEFALPGLEDIFEKTGIDTKPKASPKKGLFGRRKKAEAEETPQASDDIEELQLTQEDLERLLQTLSSYPLNLRIACEEMIAEHVLTPQQLSKLIRLLVNGANVKETAAHAEEVTGKEIIIPKSFQKSTGAAFADEQASFAYIFIHNFLPILRLFAVIGALGACIVFLGYRYIYTPLYAESLYKRGYERIYAGEYQRANELFHEAFVTHRKKKWFYAYAEGFRDERRYVLSEGKYDELLIYYPRDKKGVLDYAHLETYYLMNYEKANRLLQYELLDYNVNDFDGLLASGDNYFMWADSNPERFGDKYEDARYAYARLLDRYGWQAPVVERMMRYFIRTDNLREVLPLREWFDGYRDRKLSAEAKAELGGYLLDKQLEEVKGVPDPYVESIESVRSMLLEAVKEKTELPEPHYHLARYYKHLGNSYEERLTLENAIRAFDLAREESVRRRIYRVDTHFRYANLLIDSREFFPAEEQAVRGIELYEDFISRNLLSPSVQLGKLYAVRGDLEYFVKSGDMQAALDYYHRSERYGWAPPEIQYRIGAAYYHLENWQNSLDYLFKASADLPLNRRLLYAMGNVAYKRGDYFAANGYYNRLLDLLESQRVRMPILLPNDRPEFLELGERIMMARNNAGVTNEALANITGSREYRSKALALYAESARAWDAITRNPVSMARMRIAEAPGTPGVNLGFLNANNALRPSSNYTPEIFIRIDKDVVEPSYWEELTSLW